MTQAGDTDWQEKMASMLGQQVRVVLDYEDKNAVAVGQLLAFTEDGEVVVLDEMGVKHYCWPNLKTELVDE